MTLPDTSDLEEPPDDMAVPDAGEDQMVISVDDGEDDIFLEWDPSYRYSRYPEVLGMGAMKTVYRAYDVLDCKEVAWNKAHQLGSVSCEEEALSVHHEVQLLQGIHHPNIIRIYAAWPDENGCTNFISELCYSNLLEYRLKHRQVSRKAIKCWGRQILSALAYLHGQQPPVIHRDLKCENIYIKCSSLSTIKIGDFGCATVHGEPRSPLHSVVGTPEFMAPEIFQENYNELVDVYSFGMCMLELLTGEYPYSECNGAAQVYKKVVNGVKPKALNKIKDVEALGFVNRCLLPVSQRPSAAELLSNNFLQVCVESSHSKYGVCGMRKSNSIMDLGVLNITDAGMHSIHTTNTTLSAKMIEVNAVGMNGLYSLPADLTKAMEGSTTEVQTKCDGIAVNMCTKTSREKSRSPYRARIHGKEMVMCNLSGSQSCQLLGKVVDDNTIKFLLHIQDSHHGQNIRFPFNLSEDTAESVAEEMVSALQYPDLDVARIANLISQGIRVLTTCNAAGAQTVNSKSAIAAKSSDVEEMILGYREDVATANQPCEFWSNLNSQMEVAQNSACTGDLQRQSSLYVKAFA